MSNEHVFGLPAVRHVTVNVLSESSDSCGNSSKGMADRLVRSQSRSVSNGVVSGAASHARSGPVPTLGVGQVSSGYGWTVSMYWHVVLAASSSEQVTRVVKSSVSPTAGSSTGSAGVHVKAPLVASPSESTTSSRTKGSGPARSMASKTMLGDWHVICGSAHAQCSMSACSA